MSKYRLLITDIDGTLIPIGTQEIPKANVEALIAIQKQGIKVAIASGRIRQGIEDFANELRLDEYGGYVISNNGAEMIDWKTKEVLYRNYLKPAEVRQLCEDQRELDINCMMMQEEYVVMSGYDKAVQVDHDAIPMDFIWPHDIMKFTDLPTFRFGFTASISRLDEVEQIFREKYGETLEIMRPQRIFLDVMSKGVDKSTAVRALAEKLEIPLDQVVACGDGGNDLNMICEAGLGVASAEAFAEVKQVAKVVGPSATQGVLAWVVENYF